MPNRLLKESICTSETIDQLSAFEETFFYRLIVNCDDYGLMDARPAILKARLFPLKEEIRAKQIEDALRKLTSLGTVTTYTVEGKPFLMMNAWDRHQQIRAARGKYPAPDGNIPTNGVSPEPPAVDPPQSDDTGNHMISDDITCNQAKSSDSICHRNPIQSESESKTESNARARARKRPTDGKLPAGFERFWEVYPKHEAKKDAIRAFEKLAPDAMLIETMIKAVRAQMASAQWLEDGGRFIPHAATWINGRRWEDAVTPSKARAGKTVAAQRYSQRDYTEDQLAGDSENALIREAMEGTG